jgi:hypothetical protein
MAPLRVAVLNAMAERRQLTSTIPGTSLLIQAWKETEEGSGLRKMLIGWTAEHSTFLDPVHLSPPSCPRSDVLSWRNMLFLIKLSFSAHLTILIVRANPMIRIDFAKSLPQEILSELVIVMSDFPAGAVPTSHVVKHHIHNETIDAEAEQPRGNKRVRRFGPESSTAIDDAVEAKPAIKKVVRKSDGTRRNSRRVSLPSAPLTLEQEMDFCRGLIERMIRGPGFWTRLVGPFKHPVDPVVDNVPNYFDVVKHPMDLNTIRTKMNNGAYKNGSEFEADVRLIFQNCYEYWTQDDPVWKTCQEFENYFDTQWAERHEYKGPKNRVKGEAVE